MDQFGVGKDAESFLIFAEAQITNHRDTESRSLYIFSQCLRASVVRHFSVPPYEPSIDIQPNLKVYDYFIDGSPIHPSQLRPKE